MSLVAAAALTGLATLGSSLINNSFQRKENSITRSREDNAISRQVADLRNAGMSPLLASGQGASAQSLTAPSFDLDGVGKGIEQAIALKQAKGQLDLFKSQGANLDANTKLAEANTKVANEQAKAITQEAEWMKENGYRERTPVGAVTQKGLELFNYLTENNGLNDGKGSFDGDSSSDKRGGVARILNIPEPDDSFTRGIRMNNPFLRKPKKDTDHYYKARGKRAIHIQE